VYATSNSYVSASLTSGFTIVKLINNQIQVFHTYINNNKLNEDTVSVLSGLGNGWQYLGNYEFANPAQLIFVYNQGLIRINSNGASLLPIDNLNLSSITLSDQSSDHLYLFATDPSNKTLLIQITPAMNPTYTEIFAPNQYQITQLNVLENDDFTYQANRLDNNTRVFGFYSTSYLNEILNYQNITASQLITVK
jgi:hypothetical protein